MCVCGGDAQIYLLEDIFLIAFRERGRDGGKGRKGREREREGRKEEGGERERRETSMCHLLVHAPTRDRPRNLGRRPDQESNM